jgi:hypothetical protein
LAWPCSACDGQQATRNKQHAKGERDQGYASVVVEEVVVEVVEVYK